MTPREKIIQIQTILGVTADGIFGPRSKAALEALIQGAGGGIRASSFADPADVAAFRRCKAQGGTDQECFKVGDNGIGFRGMNCATDEACICALPFEVWKDKWGDADTANGKSVVVSYNGKDVEGVMGDTMPHLENIHNGARIDLNPGFAKAFGISPPFLINGVTWRWS